MFARTIRRAIKKNELWPNTGNKESFRKSFFDRSSILIWFFQNYGRNKKRYENIMQSHEFSHLNFIRLKNRKEARKLIEKTRNKLNQLDAQKTRTSA